ncbi:hypothetical protein DL89DRAFT_293458 [Linderina pennispora]|uniref:Transcriptional regulatory protein RXT2 N-terminal domain-containing protein n=1 Tax=Linderina pennispora TaxID=61395 RepID=A0A1Y1W6X3_9FUNG|nr:uncharacterized protein DL89DRAFT_293458 [Linderina pennispora]ORX68976.1 hypothetical protein DL89DRAFT_293458 [Linderina pennispora]
MSTLQSTQTAAAPVTTAASDTPIIAAATTPAVAAPATAAAVSTNADIASKTETANGETKPEPAEEKSALNERPRIWRSDTEKIIEEATRPLDTVADALQRPYVQKTLSSNLMEIMAWDLMETMTTENEYNQHIRRFLNILLGDDPETAHLELIDNYNMEDVRARDQLLQLVYESLARSDEFLHRVDESRSKITFAIEQRNQLKTRMEKTAGTAELLKGLEDARAQYKASWQRARELAVALDPDTPGPQLDSSDSADQRSKLQEERDRLYAEAVDKSNQIHNLLECARQLQLTSAQLLQVSK